MLKARMLMLLRFCLSIMAQTRWLSKISYASFIQSFYDEPELKKRKLKKWDNISLSHTVKRNLRYGCILIVVGNIIIAFALY
ncbi:hypothetical protein [Pasteurella sp. PK-2025]|uniref:hypothetical protein n=1 Tax=unclassified Pasteurella TaxID=2621516 RepID=UPI003C70E188